MINNRIISRIINNRIYRVGKSLGGNFYTYFGGDGKRYTIKTYDYVGDFHEGLALVKMGDKYGFIDKNGVEVIMSLYDFAFDFENGFAMVMKGDKYGFIDKNGVWYDEKPNK